jgi:hypothetical protein
LIMDEPITTTTDTTGTPAPVVNDGDAGAPPVTPPVVPPVVEPPAAPVVPEGYVKAEDVETERTARTAAETARTEAETRASAAEARARQAEINAAAQKLGFNDPADAALYVGADVTDIEGALASVIEAKPYLKRAVEVVTPPVTPTSPTNPARTSSAAPTFTQAQISDRTFWAANKPAIMQAMKEGRITS